jgi:hypothetical protein
MSEFVEQDRPEDDAHQREAATGIRLSMGSRLGHPDESQQKQESQMDAEFDSEDTPRRDGPTTHRERDYA